MYHKPSVIDTNEPIQGGEKGTVWKVSGGKTGFKASYEAVAVKYDPGRPEGEQFYVRTSTPIGGTEVSVHGSKAEAVAAAKDYGKRNFSKLFESAGL